MLQSLCKLGVAAVCAAAAAGGTPAGAKPKASAAKPRLTVGIGDNGYAMFSSSRFQAMHAQTLGFRHPLTGADVHVEAPPPADLAALIVDLRLRYGIPGAGG